MGILSASASIARYRIIEDVPKELFGELPERLSRQAFRDIDHTADERSFGWVCFDNWLDPEWRTAAPGKGSYIALSMRLDTRRISPAVFKKYFQLALEDAKAGMEEGKKHVGKDRKKELKEQVRLKLMARSLPVPAVFDVAWNLQGNKIYLASTNNKVKLMFEDLFAMTFGLNLEPLAPVWLGVNMLGAEAEKRIEAVEDAVFI